MQVIIIKLYGVLEWLVGTFQFQPLKTVNDTISPFGQGAVACYLSDPQAQMDLLLVNCHLFGTNKYGVEEAVFDKVLLYSRVEYNGRVKSSQNR